MDVLFELVKGKRRLAVAVVVILVIAVSWSGFVDRKSQQYVDRAFIQALGAFATARLLNATITVAKSVQVGAGVSFQPLEVLDPVHDLVEQYSSIMKFSLASLVTQKLLLEIVSTRFFKIMLTALGLVLIACLFYAQGKYSPIIVKLFALAGLVRFVFVLAIALNALVDDAYVNPKTKKNIADLEMLSREVENFEAVGELSFEDRNNFQNQLDVMASDRELLVGEMESIKEQVMNTREKMALAQKALEDIEEQRDFLNKINLFTKDLNLKNARDDFNELEEALSYQLKNLKQAESQVRKIDRSATDIKAKLSGEIKQGWFSDFSSRVSSFRDFARADNLKERIETFIPAVVNLMALFVFKTLIMPLLFLFILLRGFRNILGIDLRAFVKAEVANVATELKMDKTFK